ncbi:MAG: D-cysteine desulfhydrase family protein [Porticoccaceae bacterium]
MISLPDKLELAQTPTSLQLLSRLSAELGTRIWVKRDDMTGCAISGNKVRKLEFVLAQAMAEGADTLITCGGLQSNHCRATAILGAQLGLKVHLILRGDAPDQLDGNLLLDSLAGAEISCYPLSQYRHLPELFEQCSDHYRQQGRKPFLIPTGASDGIGAWGYINATMELAQQLKAQSVDPSAIICASGSGGTQAGLTLGCALTGLNIPVIGFAVCDDAAYFQAKVREDMRDWHQRYQQSLDVDALDIHVNDSHIGPGYAKATPEVFATICRLAALEGLILDPVYSGKAFHGMLQEIATGQLQKAKEVVFVHTGGLFGLFAQRGQLGLSLPDAI